MSVKIRLQRHGRKGKPFYWVVAADARSKRDGRSLEKLGTYNPNTNPATIELDIDTTVKWLQNGAQPTDTARAILSYKGAMLKNHLVGGVRKGALTEEQAEEKFQAWIDEKESKVSDKATKLAKDAEDVKAKALDVEKEVNAKRKASAAEVENEAIKVESDAKAAKDAAAKAEEAPEDKGPQTIDEVAAEAKDEGKKEESNTKATEKVAAKVEEKPEDKGPQAIDKVAAEAKDEGKKEEK